jgi:hypothetical protein
MVVVFSVLVLMFEQLKADEGFTADEPLSVDGHFTADGQVTKVEFLRPCFKSKMAVATATFSNYMKNSYLYCRSKQQGMPLRDITTTERNSFVKKFRKQESKAYDIMMNEVGEKALYDLGAVINNIMSADFARNLKKHCENAGNYFDKTLRSRFSERQLPDFALASKLMPKFYKSVICESAD